MARQPLYRRLMDQWLRVQVVETNIPGFESWLHSLLAIGFWVNYLTLLHFRFPTCKMRINDNVYFLEAL